ncbi:dnaJ homolog subfamily B member 6-like isoform X2 [Durio zibethinus]|uniref:DnaJ homolog subfamily B member 6-like isoform X2 n=1 Tax=Durio zibethinus TaxID=66656 RepID=A0A6P5XAT6_DURZI|nr:dnaJ homolog subfamily B member 6-like isoform X2 [Durio zibethinus]
MANRGEKNNDFYAVLGLNKECTPTELRTAYKKLALRWHPDRCSASGNSKFVEEAKKKFQAIQQAYSVLSDANKRFLYDVGAYDSDDDENGMGDFLNEMAEMMSHTKSSETGEESLEELQELFEEMFQSDFDSFGSSGQSTMSCSASSSFAPHGESSGSNKRNSSDMSSGAMRVESTYNFNVQFHGFCLGVRHNQDIKQQREARGGMLGMAGGSSRRRSGRKQKGDDGASWGQDGACG